MGELPSNLVDLIQKLLIINPDNRINWDQYLEHPFITNDIDDQEGKLNPKINITGEKSYLNHYFFYYRIDGDFHLIHQYKHQKEIWVAYKIKLTIPKDPTFVSFLGKIFLIARGTLDLSFNPVNTCLMIDLNEENVKSRAKQIAIYPIKSVSHGAVGIKNFIVCCGGETTSDPIVIPNCYKYSIANHTWFKWLI